MKILYSFLLILISTTVYSQATVTVNAGNVLKTLTGKENGINLNYLMDGTYLSPATSTVQSLKNVKARLLRYPGGEKSDNYLFSVAPYNSSSPRVALLDTCFWPSNDNKFVDINSAERLCRPSVLDFDEFISMCTAVGADPLVVVAYDAAYNTRVCNGKPSKEELLTNAVEWVRYANVKKGYGVKYWMVGNESWNNPEYNGKVSASKYADDLEDFAGAMKAVDPSIKIIANGRSDWWETILKSNGVSLIDFLGFSAYPVYSYTGGYEYYRTHDVNLTNEVEIAIEHISRYAAAPHKSRIKVIATEYNSIDWANAWISDNNIGHALVNFQMFGDMVINPGLEAACMWNTRWVQNSLVPQNLYDALDAEGNINANGVAMSVWGDNLLSSMVNTATGDEFVKAYASYDDTGKKLNVFLLNKDNNPRQAEITLQDFVNDFKGSVWRFSGASVSDKFPEYVKVDSVYEPGDISMISLPANSVTVLKLQKDDITLPVKLVSFEAKKGDAGVMLNWVTSEEKDLSEYIIERSNDGSIFSSIGTVAAKNTDSSLYAYVDTKSVNAPMLYYRLVVVEADGSKVSSRVVSVTVSDLPQLLMVGVTCRNC
jgi:alpha-L-arabinofuranosidase